MLTLIKPDSTGLILHCDDYCVKELANGLDELEFELSIWDEAYPYLVEEARIKEESPSTTPNWYLVKAIDAGDETVTIKCQIDLDDWKVDFMKSRTVYASMSPLGSTPMDALWPPTGGAWTIVDNATDVYAHYASFTVEGITPYIYAMYLLTDVFYDLGYRFDTVNKVLTLCNTKAASSSLPYVTRDLNLREINYKGKSTEFATRLYPYGENGLDITSVNGGVAYIDNHTYSNKVVCAYWQDDAYQSAAGLKTDATARLAEMAQPQRSYEVDVVDLAAANPDEYSFLSFPLFQPAVLIDEARGLRATLRVVERWIYPSYPTSNKIIFSTTAQRIQSQVAKNSARKII